MTATDALEFLIVGATAVQVGTANFVNPNTGAEIVEGLGGYLEGSGIADIREIIGSLKTP
jgi:dihydroorotate dehydrogenase (NAD+) catalytic subunit